MSADPRAWACTPSEIRTDCLVLIDTFGKSEREFAGWLIVRLHQVYARAWGEPFRLPEFVDLAMRDVSTHWRLSNPFLRPDFRWLLDNNMIAEVEPGNPSAGAYVLPAFVDRCIAGPMYRGGPDVR